MNRTLKKTLTLSLTGLVWASFAHPALARHGDDDSHSSGSSSSAGSSVSSGGSSSSAGSSSSRSTSSSRSSASSSSASSSRGPKALSRLKATTGVVTTARGQVEYEAKTKKAERRLVIKVKVPVGSLVPPLADLTAAENIAITASILRADASIAECTLDFDRASENQNTAKAEFKLDVRIKRGRNLRSSKGSCSVAQGDSAVEGLPALKKGDKVEIKESSVGTFLEATL